MAIFEYETQNLPGTAALDPEKTLSDIGVTLSDAEAAAAGADTFVAKTFELNSHALEGTSLNLTAADVGAQPAG